MGDSAVFQWASEEIERTTSLNGLEARGTVRLALKQAGLEPGGVTAEQMAIVLRKIFPEELRVRGVADSQDLCDRLAERLAAQGFGEAGGDPEAPESVFRRLGG